MSRILCVEDDPSLLRTLGANLRARGYEVDAVGDGRAALESAQQHRPDAVLLDLGLPDISGIDVIRSLRDWASIPIIILSARDTELDKIAGLDAGADDYITKPFGMGELLARLRAALRRGTNDEQPIISTEHFTIDLINARITTPAGEVKLTPTEWSLVEYLVRNPDRLVTSKEILQAVWGPRYGTETNYLRVHMTHIRRKLEPVQGSQRYFRTETGMGYRFTPSQTR